MTTIDCTRPTQQQLEAAFEIVREQCRQWYALDGMSASDLLDQTLHNAKASGIVTHAMLDAWCCADFASCDR